MGADKQVDPESKGYEPMFVMLAYLAVLITAAGCIYKLMG